MFNFLKNIGPTELIIIALILIVFFGAKLITRLAKTSGETVKEIKNMKKTITQTLDDEPDKTSREEVSK